MKTGIIIPCFNEEKRLNVLTFLSFLKANGKYHLCFVNNGSKDNTIEVLEEFKKNAQSKVSIVDIKKKKGIVAVVRAGVRYLNTREDIEIIGFLEMDLSISCTEFQKLIDDFQVEKNWIKVYSPRGKGKGRIERSLFKNLFTKFLQIFLGQSVIDTINIQ